MLALTILSVCCTEKRANQQICFFQTANNASTVIVVGGSKENALSSTEVFDQVIFLYLTILG